MSASRAGCPARPRSRRPPAPPGGVRESPSGAASERSSERASAPESPSGAEPASAGRPSRPEAPWAPARRRRASLAASSALPALVSRLASARKSRHGPSGSGPGRARRPGAASDVPAPPSGPGSEVPALQSRWASKPAGVFLSAAAALREGEAASGAASACPVAQAAAPARRVREWASRSSRPCARWSGRRERDR